jgi:hypothetical protein
MDIKYLFREQIILTVIIIFIVLYIIVNFDNIYNSNIFDENNNIRKPLLLALIISLLGYLFVTWDDNDSHKSEGIQPKYKIVNNRVNNKIEDQPIIIDLPPYRLNSNNNFKNDNESIFMSQKQANARYGLKF